MVAYQKSHLDTSVFLGTHIQVTAENVLVKVLCLHKNQHADISCEVVL